VFRRHGLPGVDETRMEVDDALNPNSCLNREGYYNGRARETREGGGVDGLVERL